MIDIDKINLTKEWSEVNFLWLVDDVFSSVAYVAFYLNSPNHYPRNFDIVMKEFMDKFLRRNELNQINKNVILIECSLVDLCKKIYDDLIEIDEFKKWNLTDEEYEHNVDVDSDERNEWFDRGNFFIDLESFMQNVYCVLRSNLIELYFFEK